MPIESEFVKFSADKLEQLCGRIETCIGALTPEQVWTRHSENQNAVGNLVLHLNGNVRQWILSGVGGAPDRRVRDVEFSNRDPIPPEGLTQHLRETVEQAAKVIRGLPASALMERTLIQGYEVTKMEAIYHVVEHFSGHAFQIIFATKLLTGEDMGFYSHLNHTGAHGEKVP